METLQLAQMLADLSSLNAAEPNAAAALVTANKAILTVERQHADTLAVPRRPTDELRRTNSAQGFQRAGGSPPSPSPAPAGNPARFDKFGRRILMSPPLSRTNSAQASGAATPRRDSEMEDDLDRASTLMALYEIRAKLKQQDNSSLLKAREKIAELAARQQQQQQQQQQQTQHMPNPAAAAGPGRKESRFSYPE